MLRSFRGRKERLVHHRLPLVAGPFWIFHFAGPTEVKVSERSPTVLEQAIEGPRYLKVGYGNGSADSGQARVTAAGGKFDPPFSAEVRMRLRLDAYPAKVTHLRGISSALS